MPYKLTIEAKADLNAAFEYGIEYFGERVALAFMSSMYDAFEILSHFNEDGNPSLRGRPVGDEFPGTYRWTKTPYVIFYSIETDQIIINRVLHSSTIKTS